MSGAEIVSDIVEILVAGLTELGTGIGQGVNNFVSALAIQGTGENASISVFLVFICVFGGIALAVGLTTLVFNWLSSLGK